MDGVRVIILSEAKVAALLGETPASSPAPPPPPAPPGWLTPEQYGQHAGFSAKKIRQWSALAPRAAAWKVGREWRIDRDAFDAWLRGGGPQAVAFAIGREQRASST